MPNQSSIPASSQFAAVAYLRWRLFANAFRRKGGAGELAARIVVYPIGFVLLLGPTLGAFFGSYFAVHEGNVALMSLVFWLVFLLQIVVSINLSPAAQSFDPESLIRFPLSFSRYLVVRLFLGLLSPSTVAGTLSLLAAATGASLARPALGPIVFAAALVLALANMFFVRMIFAWVDRWLSTRRARELFTGFIILFSIGIQYLNVTFNNLGHHANRAAQKAKVAAVVRFYHHSQPILNLFPPGLAGSAVLSQSLHKLPLALTQIAGVLLFAALFLAVFAWRMHREYRGENLSEPTITPASETSTLHTAPAPLAAIPAFAPSLPVPAESSSRFSPVLAANLQKEWIYLRRNVSQFYGFLAPLAMVVIFAGRLGSFSRTGLIFPIAVAYSFLGIAALTYNIFGLDASGIQTYFLAPIRMRSVFLAKNLFGFGLAFVQLLLVYLVVLFISGPPPLLLTLATVSWIVFATLTNAAIGNIRSVVAPKKMDPGKLSRRQASQLSAMMSLGIMLLAAGLGAGFLFLSRSLQLPWLPLPIFLGLAVVALVFYLTGLNRVDALVYAHREDLVEELSKAS